MCVLVKTEIDANYQLTKTVFWHYGWRPWVFRPKCSGQSERKIGVVSVRQCRQHREDTTDMSIDMSTAA